MFEDNDNGLRRKVKWQSKTQDETVNNVIMQQKEGISTKNESQLFAVISWEWFYAYNNITF